MRINWFFGEGSERRIHISRVYIPSIFLWENQNIQNITFILRYKILFLSFIYNYFLLCEKAHANMWTRKVTDNEGSSNKVMEYT